MHTFSSPSALEASPVAAVNLQTISSPSIPHFLPLMLCTFPLLLPWILPPWMHQLFPYSILIKLFLWNLQTQIIFISKCRWNHISLDKVFSTLLMALSCPPPRVVAADSVSLQINNSFWKQQNQLILSALLSFFLMDELHCYRLSNLALCLAYS
jgi:hypothetical protein